MTHIGKGAYGSVERRNQIAVKTFTGLCFLTQEYAAFSYLRGAQNVVQVIDANPQRLELYLTLYDMNLREFMNRSRVNRETAITISLKIAHGLAEIHKRNLTHGDLKPGNILLKLGKSGESEALPNPHAPVKTDFTLAIGDLGLTGPHHRSRCHLTAKSYADPVIVPGPQHDIFSFGIIMIELFSGFHPNPKGDSTYEELKRFVDQHISDDHLAKFLRSMVSPDRVQRPSAIQVYHFLSGQYPKLTDPQIPRGWKPTKTSYYKLYGTVPRPYKGYAAICRYIIRRKIPEIEHVQYHRATILLLYLLFGTNERLSAETYTPELLNIGYQLLKDPEFVSYIMSISPTGRDSISGSDSSESSSSELSHKSDPLNQLLETDYND
jgi:serine/threonine protein kinase